MSHDPAPRPNQINRTRGGLRCLTTALLAVSFLTVPQGPIGAADCGITSLGFDPLTSLGTGLYLNLYQGGLYPSGSNSMPSEQAAEGVRRGQALQPLDSSGNPDPNGAIVMMSVGMSNTSLEYCGGSHLPCSADSFVGQAMANQMVDRASLRFVNGATGGRPVDDWDDSEDEVYDFVLEERLQAEGFTEAQVQVVWLLHAHRSPTVALPDTNADAFTLTEDLGEVMRALRVRYPNLSMVYLSSRIYAGYASTLLSPEPYAYESGFSVKWLIESQIEQMDGAGVDARTGDLDYADGTAPWLAWGPYLWADGLEPRPDDGLVWRCSDFNNDGTHPGPEGRRKVGEMLVDFLLDEPSAAPWFLADPGSHPPPPGPGAECIADARTLCLQQDGYSVRARWTTANGTGPGSSRDLTDDTGLFWFFDQNNVELMVKVLDACAVNGHRWVYAGGSTDVGVEIEVEELATGARKSYRNNLGSAFRAVRDSFAFPCPPPEGGA